jgi:8-oxo-dGTP diphosphatase
MDFRLAVKAVVMKDNQVLLIKRRPNDVHKPGQWDLPGGRLDLGEEPWGGLKRETNEETGLEVEPILPFDLHHFTRDDGQKITMIFFLCKALTDEVVLSEEHTAYQWVEITDTTGIFPQWVVPVLAKVQTFNLLQTQL